MRSRLVVGSVCGVITAALVAGTTAFVSLDKHVTISVDGQVTKVRTYAASVDGVLHRAGITVGPHDSLTPAPQSKVHDGSTITIARGRLLTLTIDGVTHQAWVTGDNVDQVLQQAGLRIPQAADVSVDRGARVPLTGMNISINLPHLVNVHVDGTVHSLVSTQTTLAGVLAEAGIVVNPVDQISSDLQTRPYDGLTVIILRISSGQELASSQIPFTTSTVADPNLLVGTKKVEQVGKIGTMVATYQDGYVDGVQTTKSLVGQQVTVPPVAQIIGIGTKPKPKPKPKPAPVFKVAADGLNWKALAACEVGGRANAVDPPFYGMYQFRAQHVARSRRHRTAERRLRQRADVSRATALQAQQLADPMAGLRPLPLHLITPSTPASSPGPGVLLGATDVRALAASIGLTPTKTLGQNFVIDGGTVRRIVRTASLRPDDVVLEIGPGLGSLTLALLPDVRRVIAVEIDGRLAGLLPSDDRVAIAELPRPTDRRPSRRYDSRLAQRRSPDGDRREPAVQRRRPGAADLARPAANCSPGARHGAARGGCEARGQAGGGPVRRAVGQGRLVRVGPDGRHHRAPGVLAGAARRFGTRRPRPARSAPHDGDPRRGVRGDRCRVWPTPQDLAGSPGRLGRIAGDGRNCLTGSGN